MPEDTATPKGWTDVEYILLNFGPNTTIKGTETMHLAMNDFYGDSLEGETLDALFTNAQRTKLKPDAISLIKEHFIKVVQTNATATPEEGRGRIATIVRSLPMVCNGSDRITLSRVSKLENAFKKYEKRWKEFYIDRNC